MQTENNNISIENLEINVLYILSMAMERILDDIERRLLEKKQGFRHEKKKRFKDMIESAKNIKRLSDLIDQIDFAEGLAGRYERYQSYQEDAYRLARIILLCADRDTEDPSNLYEVQKLLRSQKGANIITEEVLKRFYLNK
jgi:hypothetical protein